MQKIEATVLEPKIPDQLLMAKIADQHFGTEVIENKSRGQSFGPKTSRPKNLGPARGIYLKNMDGKIILKCM